MSLRPRFWQTVPMTEMTPEEWEALCDGCGRCCTFVLDDEETGELFPTRVACQLLDHATCRCSDYADRQTRVSWCIRVTPETIGGLTWFPQTCGYRRVAAGADLPDWHHLVCGDPGAVHRLGPSLAGVMVDERDAGDDFERYIIDPDLPLRGSELIPPPHT